MSNQEKSIKDISTVCLSPEELAKLSEYITEHKATKPVTKCLLSAVNAGAFIALAFMFYTTCLADGYSKLIGGICFSLGLLLCVVMGGELFTSSTLTLVAKSAKLITWKKVFSNWSLVYIGNLIGSLLIVTLVMIARQYEAFDGKWGAVILNTSLHKLEHMREGEPYWRGFLECVASGIFCNLMVCIGVWVSFAGKTLTDKAVATIFPVALFVSSGFEHCIANMFMIPAGICVLNFADAEFWRATGLVASDFAQINVVNFIINNLIPVTIGNIIGGGIMIGVYNWYTNCRAGQTKA
ncbi:MAG: formate transporter FocA [Ruminobacter sp.]|jgi:formate transporter|nr:formate transporter FocA [Ruminobacter sp.]